MSTLEITAQKLSDTTASVVMKGYLGATVTPDLQKSVLDLHQAGVHKFVLDLSGLNHMSSAGAGVLIQLLERVRSGDPAGNLVLVNSNPVIGEMLDMLGLSIFFKIVPDQAAALKSLGSIQENKD